MKETILHSPEGFNPKNFSPKFHMQIAPILTELGFVDTKEVNQKLSCLDLPLIDLVSLSFPGETTQLSSCSHSPSADN